MGLGSMQPIWPFFWGVPLIKLTGAVIRPDSHRWLWVVEPLEWQEGVPVVLVHREGHLIT